jgi:signal recognition particle subunit SEC65
MHISIGYQWGVNKMTHEGEGGQIGFTDEEMGLNFPKQEPTEISKNRPPEAVVEATHEKDKRSDPGTFLLSAEVGTMLDPHPPKGQKAQEISIHDYLLREIDNSWQESHHKAEIARIIIDRFNKDPEAILLLAKAYRTVYISKLEEDIKELKRELEESVDKHDDVYNPRASAQQQHLRITIKESERTLEHKKLVANDIAYGLEKIANLI